jgi:hypothetical protein
MNVVGVTCPKCQQAVKANRGCRHLRWTPARGGPIEFAKSLLAAKPREGVSAARILAAWWEAEFDWLLDRILARVEVIDGYCFAEQDAVDRLCIDIWNRLSER